MDYKLIENWNKTVPPNGLVFHLGDFSFGSLQQWKSIREQLNGRIILIKGNHDMKNGPQSDEKFLELFDQVSFQMRIHIGGKNVWLNHFPFLCYSGTYRDVSNLEYQLYGHVHSGPNKQGADIHRLKYLFPTQYDVGVDNNNYTPISWKEVNDKISKQLLKAKFNRK